MEAVQIEFEPFIGEAARQFIVNGLDMHNIAATVCPTTFRSTSSCAGTR